MLFRCAAGGKKRQPARGAKKPHRGSVLEGSALDKAGQEHTRCYQSRRPSHCVAGTGLVPRSSGHEPVFDPFPDISSRIPSLNPESGHRQRKNILKSESRRIVTSFQVDDRFWRTWQDRYLHEPTTVTPHGSPAYPLPSHLHSGVLGGEVACWGRCIASPRSIDAYLWLPMAAVSERLWSQASQRNVSEARPRLLGALSRLGGRDRAERWLRFHEREQDGNGKDIEGNGENDGS